MKMRTHAEIEAQLSAIITKAVMSVPEGPISARDLVKAITAAAGDGVTMGMELIQHAKACAEYDAQQIKLRQIPGTRTAQ